jgi:hypothetical protein
MPEAKDPRHPLASGDVRVRGEGAAASREARFRPRKAGRPGGHPPALTLAEQALVTVLRQRFRTPQHVLAGLFGVVTGTIARAERQVRPLLDQHSPKIDPAATPIKTLAALTAYASAHGIDLTPKAKPAC